MLIVKIGGGAEINLEGIAADLARMDEPVVAVHGANALRDRLARDLGCEVKRVTSLSGFESVFSDASAMDLLLMAYSGLRNKRLVELLQQVGVNAVGLSGVDGGLIRARRNRGIRTVQNGKKVLLRDFSGKPEAVNRELLTLLLDRGYLPVLTVPVLDETGFAVNTENDEITAVLHRELGADRVAHLIEAPGLLEDTQDPDSLIPELDAADLAEWEGRTRGRMKRKIRALRKLFDHGPTEVFIGDGRIDRPLEGLLAGKGTRIR